MPRAHLRSDRNPGRTECVIPFTSGSAVSYPGDKIQLRCKVQTHPEGSIHTFVRYRGLGVIRVRSDSGAEFNIDIYKVKFLNNEERKNEE